VLTEGYDKQFLGRHFQADDGNLYEGGVLQEESSRSSSARQKSTDRMQIISAARA
jgi:hypothetical protein